MNRAPDRLFFSRENVIGLRDWLVNAGVPHVDPAVLTHHMLAVSREMKIHYDDDNLMPMNKETILRMLEWGHPNAAYNDDVGRLPDKSQTDVGFRDDTSGQPPQFEEKPVTLPPHLARQIQYKGIVEY